MIRSIAAVVVGLLVTLALVYLFHIGTIVLTGLPLEGSSSRPYLIANLVASFIAGACGGAAAVRVAAHTPHGHVVALAMAILVLSLPTLFAGAAPGQPTWYPALMSVLGPVSVLTGGLLAARRWRSRRVEPVGQTS
jgi:hypothetical protein